MFKEFEVQNVIPIPEQVKEAFNTKLSPTNIDKEKIEQNNLSVNFKHAFDEFVKECWRQNDWTKSTYEKFTAVKKHLKSFNPAVTFEFFDKNGLNGYVDYLRNMKDMRNSTIGK